jgi:hypothetical protein
MAEVTEMTGVSPVMPPPNGSEPLKRGRGRPRKDTKPPEVTEEEDDAPELVTGNEDFWLRLLNYSLDEWNYLTAYLYRVRPRIDRKSNGKDCNIQAFSVPFTREEIMLEHGSGVYRIDLCALEPAGSKSHRIAREVFSIINYKYPPMVPVGDWVEEKGNAMWKWGGNMPGATAMNGGAYPPGFNISDMMDKADQRALKMVEIMTPKENGNLETVLTSMIQMNSPERLIALVQAIAPKPDGSLALIVELLRADLKESKEEMRLMRERMLNTPPPKNIVEQFLELKPAIAELVPLFGGRAGKTDIWADIAKEGMGQLPDLIALGRDMIAKKAPELQPNGHKPQPGIAAAAPASTDPPAKPIAEMTEDEKRAHIDRLWKSWGGHLLAISSKLVEEFAIQDNGYSFRDWYVDLYGKLKWAALKRDIDPGLMANMYLAHDQLKTALSPPLRLLVFMQEFATDFEAEDETPLQEKMAALSKAVGVEKSQSEQGQTQSEANGNG